MSLTPLRSLSGHTARYEQLVPGSYITDGHRLFRVVSQTAERDGFASLENCFTLEVQTYSPGQLATMKLRPIFAAPGR